MNPYSLTNLLLATIVCIATLLWATNAIHQRANMAQVHANFTHAIQTVKGKASQQDSSGQHFTADGIPTVATLPTNTGAWISEFSRKVDKAPEGGPAYIVNNTGSDMTGAIGVTATNYGKEVRITRPPYRDLESYTATVTADQVELSSS